MAFLQLTVTGRGSTVTESAAITTDVSVTANIMPNKILVACLAADNSSIANGNTTTHTIADVSSNIWVKVGEHTNSGGEKGSGVTISMFVSRITTQINSGNNITFTHASVTARCAALIEVTIYSGHTIGIGQVGVGQAAIGASVTGLPLQQYFLVGLGGSEGIDNSKTVDTDYTEVFDLISGTGGDAASHIAIHVVYRIATLTADTCTSADWDNTDPEFMLAAFYETSLTPGNMFLMFEKALR